jgi:pimeloyl-ACP methyl ester carboxylesterase
VEQLVHFDNDHGEKLTGTLHLPDVSAGCGIILGHCFTCSRHTTILRRICSDLTLEGFMALRFDFSGNGQSEGTFADSTYSKQISEMQTAVALLAGKGAVWIGLAGHSMGAAIALLTAARLDIVKAVCVLAGRFSELNAAHFLSPDQRQQLQGVGSVSFSSRGRSLELSNRFFADAGQYNLPQVVGALQPPLLVVHGDQDEIIPVQEAYQAQALNPAGATLAVIPDADHMFSNAQHRRQISELVVTWFKEQKEEHPHGPF